ncbi:ABC transporter ATP-binding protein [Leucothrix pacifica]|uniref:ABC transporter ATP-binding protein n=1 Tax=Leucothrix pacifica TaxID=1247513 RepID=A0A317C3S3_9GAMM|nr:ABC transporter ATP-binding protein [Leucothrix pacifica]PWQ93346.1 ABC transporter ATP-binding protein [Leucothrix pacifica]
MASISLSNLSKRWGKVYGARNINLDIADREFIVFLGPSGCGKTTTMRMIAGLEDPSEGEIRIGDRVVNKLEPKDRDVAMVFQSYGLYPNLTVYENIRFPLKVRKVDETTHDERVRRAAAMVELGDLLDRLPRELSGGQRQRVALARAVVREPTVFLMDEPLSNLDAKLRVSTRAQLKNLQHELQVTTIYVTHDQIEAMTLADRVVVMESGEIQQVTLGFRAEDAQVSGTLNQSNAEILAPVYSMELLGDATMVSVRVGEAMVSVKADKDYRIGIGEPIGLEVAAAICHLFDKNTGERLSLD